MRSWRGIGSCSLAWLVLACTDSSAAGRTGDGRLVLELGGAHASLRQALMTAGVEPSPEHRLRSEGPAPEGQDPAATKNEPAPPPRADSPPDPARSSDAEDPFVVVSLAEGQTLIHLARKHLGDGNRFREILALNGWTEADSRRLQAGQRVKIPRAGDANRTGR